MQKKMRKLALFVIIACAVLPVISAVAYWEEDWVTTQTKYIPSIYFRLYDPAGTNSYQEITETYSSAISLKFEAEASGNGASSTTTVSQSMSVGVRTVDSNADPSINGIGEGDVISGSEVKYTLKIWGTTRLTTWGYYSWVTNIQLISIDWQYRYFDLTPGDFNDRFGKDAPSKIGTTGAYSYTYSVSKGVAKTLTSTLEITSDQSISFGLDFSYAGVKIKSKTTTTFSSGYKIEVKTYLKDTTQRLTHTLHYSGSGYSGGSNIFANSMIPWCEVEYW